MITIKNIVDFVIQQHESDILDILESNTKLKKVLEKAVSDLRFKERGISVFTSTSAFNSPYYQSIAVDVEKEHEAIKKEIINQLYIRNIITESEYKKICRTQ